MPRANLWKSAFNGGELTPRMAGRTDQQKYGAGCSKLQNFLPTVQGPIIRRGGTGYVAPVRNSANRTWLIPFQLNIVSSYSLEFGDQYVRFYTNRGIVTDISAAITGGITQANPGVVTAASHGFSNGNTVIPTGVGGMSRMNDQYYTVANATMNTFTLVDIFGNTVDTTAYPAYTTGGTFNRVYQIATPYAVADLTDANGRCTLTYAQSEDVIYLCCTTSTYPMQVLSRGGNTNWTITPAALVNGPFQTTNTDQTITAYYTPLTTSISAVSAASYSDSVSADANNGSGLIRLTVGNTSGIATGSVVVIAGVTGLTEANGTWTVTVIDSTHIDLQGSAFPSTTVTGVANNGSGLIRLGVTSSAYFTTGDSITVASVGGIAEADGTWTATVVDSTHIDLQSSAFYNTTVTGAANNGSGHIRLAVVSTTGVTTGDSVTVAGVVGTTEANGNWTVTVIDLTHIDLQTSTFTNAYVSGGTVNAHWTSGGTVVGHYVSGGTVNLNGSPVRITVGSTTGISTGNNIEIGGTTSAVSLVNSLYVAVTINGVWAVTVIDGTHLDLLSSNYQSGLGSAGTVTGREGTTATLTSNKALFSSANVGSLFAIKTPPNSNIVNWVPGITNFGVGARVQSGINVYVAIAAFSNITGNSTPIHTQGAQFDGAPIAGGAMQGVDWQYEDSGTGVLLINSINSSTSCSVTIQVTPSYFCTIPSNASYLWANGIFSAANGYPEFVCLFRNRLILFKGIQAMGSVSDDYLNFSPTVDGFVTADSGFVISLPTANPIQSVAAQNDLLVFTEGEEIIITEIDPAQAIGPNNVKARRQTTHGSVRCDALPIEFVTMYVNKSGQQLLQQVYSWMINGYLSHDMTIFGEHIPKGPDGQQGLTQMCWAQDPDKLLWSCTTDGRLVCFTYHSEQQVTAWHNHPIGGSDAAAPLAAKGFTNAVVESVCSIPNPSGSCDDVWMIIKRTINGHEMRYVEYLNQYFTDIPANLPNAIYVDSNITYIGTPAAKIFGYDHLIGQTVSVLLNGGACPPVTVAADGSITLYYTPPGVSMTVQVGLTCPARMVTMRAEGGTQMGTAQGLVKRIHKIGIRLLQTLGLNFGDPNNPQGDAGLLPVNFRTPQMPMDSPPTLFTGDKGVPGEDDMDFQSTYNVDGFVEILCTDPLPCTIIGIRSEIDVAETAQ